MKRLSIIITTPLLLSLSACGGNSSEPIFDACFSQGMVQEMQGMEESDRLSVKGGVTQACEMLARECKKKPDGKICMAMKKKLGL